MEEPRHTGALTFPRPLLGRARRDGYSALGRYLAVLPPYNTLWAQVIRKGDQPQIVTTGITVTYGFPDNTYSVGKSNFWDYDQDLFGVDLAPNVGLTGKGMSGTLDRHGTHFVVEGIPLTERGPSRYAGALPDRITIYRRPILRICHSEYEVVRQVYITVVHEVAHHFGIDDERLHDLGYG